MPCGCSGFRRSTRWGGRVPNFPQPPSQFTGPQAAYLRQLAATLNQLPNVSYFTQQTPNGNVLGVNGDWAIYNGSASTVSHIWVNQSANTASQTSSGWGLVGTNIVINIPVTINGFQSCSTTPTSVLTTTTMIVSRPNVGSSDIVINLPTVASYGTGRTLYVRTIVDGSGNSTFIVPNAGVPDLISPAISQLTLSSGAFGLTSGTTNWFVTSQTSV